VKIRPDGTGYVGCDSCGKEVPVWAGPGTGEWVPDFPDKSDYMHGYKASALMNPMVDPAEVLEDFVNPPHGNLADVWRLSLAKAYSNKDEKLRKDDVLACCGPDSPAHSHDGPCAMGVDVGKYLNFTISTVENGRRKKLLVGKRMVTENTERGGGFSELDKLMIDYDVDVCVIDGNPEGRKAKEFQERWLGRILLAYYYPSDLQRPELYITNEKEDEV